MRKVSVGKPKRKEPYGILGLEREKILKQF